IVTEFNYLNNIRQNVLNNIYIFKNYCRQSIYFVIILYSILCFLLILYYVQDFDTKYIITNNAINLNSNTNKTNNCFNINELNTTEIKNNIYINYDTKINYLLTDNIIKNESLLNDKFN